MAREKVIQLLEAIFNSDLDIPQYLLTYRLMLLSKDKEHKRDVVPVGKTRPHRHTTGNN